MCYKGHDKKFTHVLIMSDNKSGLKKQTNSFLIHKLKNFPQVIEF